MSGFGFAAFSATMAIMRFAGDHVRDRFGGVRTLRVCTLTALVGLVLAGLAPNAPLAILGFALAGVGISNMVPIAFSAAGNMPGLAPGIGLSVATFMGYSGMLFAPSLIGFRCGTYRLLDYLYLCADPVHRRSGAVASRRAC
jgi:MFS family permease